MSAKRAKKREGKNAPQPDTTKEVQPNAPAITRDPTPQADRDAPGAELSPAQEIEQESSVSPGALDAPAPQARQTPVGEVALESSAGHEKTAGSLSPEALRPAREAVSSSSRLTRQKNGLWGFLLHLHPRMIRRRSTLLRATLGLGLATMVSLALATCSGLLLLVYYIPSVEQAHRSMQDLISVVPLGAFLRNLHRWSAHGAVLFLLLHLLRTFLWGSYRGSHRRVWLVGVALLVVTMATSYSGYLLPWDQDAYWTVTVGTSLLGYVPFLGDYLKELFLGGDVIGQPTLTRFFFLHVIALPGLGLLLLVVHLFRLRRAGGLARPPRASGSGEELVPASPHLIAPELTVTLVITIILVFLAIAIQARLGAAPDLLRPDDPPKAPWFLVGIQETVSYSAIFGGVVFPLLLLLILTLSPWLDGRTENDGAFLTTRRNKGVVLAATVLTLGTAWGSVLWWGDPQQGHAAWLNPASICAMAIAALCLVIGALWRDRSAMFLVALSGLLVCFFVFTVVGWFFRGPGWTLIFHPGPGHQLQVSIPTERSLIAADPRKDDPSVGQGAQTLLSRNARPLQPAHYSETTPGDRR